MCPQGPKSVSLFMSEHTIHSSRDSMLLFKDGLRVPTWPLEQQDKTTVSERRSDQKEETLEENKTRILTAGLLLDKPNV